MYIIQTSTSSRIIKRTIQALLKSKAILWAYKLPYAKSYFPTEQGRLQTTNIQMLCLITGPQREKSWTGILDSMLAGRWEVNMNETYS